MSPNYFNKSKMPVNVNSCIAEKHVLSIKNTKIGFCGVSRILRLI